MSKVIVYREEKIEFQEDIHAAQTIMLNILKEIHKLCVKHGISYWLSSGTLLGCIRHQGFIPWDDDCDIGMTRPDYEKFLQIAQNEFQPDLLVQTKETDKFHVYTYAKIRKKGTKIIEANETEKELYNQGIFVDVFPFEYYPSIWFLKWMIWSMNFRAQKNKYKRGSLKRTLMTLYTNYLMVFPVEISAIIRKIYIRYFQERITKKTTNVLSVSIDGCVPFFCLGKYIFPLELAKFEGEDFFIPCQYEKYLESIFGGNWRELPPVEKRTGHAKKIII